VRSIFFINIAFISRVFWCTFLIIAVRTLNFKRGITTLRHSTVRIICYV
jgi:hypothetical protein